MTVSCMYVCMYVCICSCMRVCIMTRYATDNPKYKDNFKDEDSLKDKDNLTKTNGHTYKTHGKLFSIVKQRQPQRQLLKTTSKTNGHTFFFYCKSHNRLPPDKCGTVLRQCAYTSCKESELRCLKANAYRTAQDSVAFRIYRHETAFALRQCKHTRTIYTSDSPKPLQTGEL